MPEIRQLPQSVINKIAAGEVIERPASVVKELLENAIDAKASRIDVVVAKGGSALIRVADNGCGIEQDQLALAVSSHCTSKIIQAEDLFHVQSLGFRGEALAAIAEVSQFRIRSRPLDSNAGAEVQVSSGEAIQTKPCSCSPGSVVEVQNLFYNTPVRRKFLRTPQTEMAHICEAVTRVALAWPQIHFTLTHNERLIYDLPAVEQWKDRLVALFGTELADDLIWTESRDGDLEIDGYVADPAHTRSNNRMQYLLLNGRYIRDRSLQHALSEAYRGLLMTGRYPIAFLRLRLPADQVDVNVHPTKLEVRFQDAGRLYSQLLGSLRNQFLTTDLSTKWKSTVEPAGGHTSAEGPRGDAESRLAFAEWAKAKMNSIKPDQLHEVEGSTALGIGGRRHVPADLARHEPLELNRLSRPVPEPPLARGKTAPSTFDDAGRLEERHSHFTDAEPPDSTPREEPVPTEAILAASRDRKQQAAIQVLNRYIVMEGDEGVVVIDQHALHERILYEHFKEQINLGTLETQRLLVPEPVDLTPQERAATEEHQELLRQLGLEVEPFGGDTVLIHGYPALLRNVQPGELLREVVEQLSLSADQSTRIERLDKLLHTMACKAAVKAGDSLTGEEISVLLSQRQSVSDSHHCPHGRPTSLVFTQAELDRQFMRT